MLKKLLTIILLVVAAATESKAQRFAYVDTEYILDMLPEYKSAQKQLDVIAETWQKEIEAKRQEIEKLQKEENCIAIATQGIFNTGINVFVHNLINAAGGQADHQIIQRMGRGLRTAKDKDELLYVDFLFENNPYLHKHSMKRIRILKKQGHEVEVRD
jgi:superfamily II DNA or RNA helicase